jgi:hypothetical protein
MSETTTLDLGTVDDLNEFAGCLMQHQRIGLAVEAAQFPYDLTIFDGRLCKYETYANVSVLFDQPAVLLDSQDVSQGAIGERCMITAKWQNDDGRNVRVATFQTIRQITNTPVGTFVFFKERMPMEATYENAVAVLCRAAEAERIFGAT